MKKPLLPRQAKEVFLMAEKERFELSNPFLGYAISSRARSTNYATSPVVAVYNIIIIALFFPFVNRYEKNYVLLIFITTECGSILATNR